MSQTDADHAAADAVIAHHSELNAALTRHVALLRAAARAGSQPQWREHRQNLLAWLRTELLPHAAAEEAALYPPAGRQDRGRLLVEGMLTEHQAISRLVTELESAGTPVDAAGAARALASVFEIHLGKENTLVLPLLLATDDVSLAEILHGMRDLLGAHGEGHGHGGGQGDQDSGGCGGDAGSCGCGGDAGSCGCGGDRADAAAAQAPAPVLSVDSRLDVRSVPHAQRHARVLTAVSELPAEGALVLIAPHAPLPLLAEIGRRFPGQVDSQWLQEGPDVWQVRLQRRFVAG